MTLEEFTENYRQTVTARIEGGAFANEAAEISGGFEREFVGEFLEELMDIGEIEDFEQAYLKKRGLKVNAYSISDTGERLTLFSAVPKIEDFSGNVPSITKTEIDTECKRMEEFYLKAVQGSIDVDQSSDAYQMISEVKSLADGVDRITCVVLTGGRTDKVVEIPSGELNGVETRYQMWTLERLYKLRQSGMSRESISVDFRAQSESGKGIACIESPNKASEFRTFLAVLEGDVIADLYNEYQERLLQKNVRTYLQLRGKVNRGIRDTIHDEPASFMAYNNGLTITVEGVEIEEDGNAKYICSVDDIQIVNGGQTTASIWRAKYTDKVDVSGIGVQAKINWITNSDKAEEVVKKISEYSNTQNKISGSDLSSNHSFHRKMEEISRTTRAPSTGDGQVNTFWFYERARGQYNNLRTRQGTPARIKRWEIEYPRKQMFNMTDIAKYDLAFRQMPHLVSLGAQKCFGHFMLKVVELRKDDPQEKDFQNSVAKAILFKATERIVSAQKFGGFRANIVAYTIAKLQNMNEGRINLDQIWQRQCISSSLERAIEFVSHKANSLIQIEKPDNIQNPSEWAKREKAWKDFKEISIELPFSLETSDLISSRAQGSSPSTVDVQEPVSDGAKWLRSTDPQMWKDMASWAKDTDNFQGWQRKFMFSIGKQLDKDNFIPSVKQANLGKKIYEEASEIGFIFSK